MLASVLQIGVAMWMVALVSQVLLRLGELPLPAVADGISLTPDFVVSVVAGVIALALEVVPGLTERWESLPAELRRFAWLLGCVLVGVAPLALGCLGGVLGVDLSGLWIVGTCEVDTLAHGMQVAFVAYFASQSVHGLSVAGAKAVTYFRNRGQEAESY